MKRLLLICGLALIFTSTAAAATTSTYTGSASSNSPFDVYFSTVRDGPVTVTATFKRKSNSNVWLRFGSGTDRWFSVDAQPYWCERISDNGSGTATLTCSWPSVPAGAYHAQVESWKGPTSATVTVTAETQ